MTGRRPNPFRNPPLRPGAAFANVLPLPLGEGRGEGASPPHPAPPRPRAPRGFTLVELLVAVSIILILMTLIGGGVSGARSSAKKQATKALINKLQSIVAQHYASYFSRSSTLEGTPVQRAAAVRQMISGDMPDNWKDVEVLKAGSTGLVGASDTKFPLNAAQRAYVAYFNAIQPSEAYSSAECLFMVVMVGGLADCLDCANLGLAEKGDKDGDNAPEFWDAWGNPIGFVLWPAGLELPPKAGNKFFSTTAPFASGTTTDAPGGSMRPLIFSGGPDGKATLQVSDASNITAGLDCGDPLKPPSANLGSLSPSESGLDLRADNITNFDDEVAR